MSRDPTVVGRARLSAETLGEIVNGFVEPISWKTLVRTTYYLASPPLTRTDLLSLNSGLPDHSHQLCSVQPSSSAPTDTPASAADASST